MIEIGRWKRYLIFSHELTERRRVGSTLSVLGFQVLGQLKFE
jgi:hypothetical protein